MRKGPVQQTSQPPDVSSDPPAPKPPLPLGAARHSWHCLVPWAKVKEGSGVTSSQGHRDFSEVVRKRSCHVPGAICNRLWDLGSSSDSATNWDVSSCLSFPDCEIGTELGRTR